MGGSFRPYRRRASSRIAAAQRRKKTRYVEVDFTYSSADCSEESSNEEETSPTKRSRDAIAAPKSKNQSTSKKSTVNKDDGEVEQRLSEPPQSPTGRDLEDLLNCKVCRNEPASPIHCCTAGHIICGICINNEKTCGLCQTELQVSNFAELLSRQFQLKLACQNQKSGCTELIAAAEMKLHLQTCYYRDIICTENKNGACPATKVPMSEYSKHLQETHVFFGLITMSCFVIGGRKFTLWQVK